VPISSVSVDAVIALEVVEASCVCEALAVVGIAPDITDGSMLVVLAAWSCDVLEGVGSVLVVLST
jgi:hypothetical protein